MHYSTHALQHTCTTAYKLTLHNTFQLDTLSHSVRAENSDLIAANAWHHRSDAISSFVALLGVAGAMYGFPLLDPLAGTVTLTCLVC